MRTRRVSVGLAVGLTGRLERVENRIGDLGAGIRSLNQQVASVVGLLPIAFTSLHRSKAISNEEYYEPVGEFKRRVKQNTEPKVDYLARSMNPFTAHEAQRFKGLVNKARRGEFFTYPEVQEYDSLIRKVQADHPDDPGIWPLVALGSFLLGLYRGRQREDSQGS